MISPGFTAYPVKRFYGFLDEGRFAVPKLQRAFVWNGHKAAKLLDSMYRGMPIGSITVWETSKGNKNLLRHTLHILPPFQEHNKRVWFILDGQQRLSVIYRVREGGEKQNGSRQIVDFDRVVFRVTDKEDRPRFQYRNPVPGEWVSLSKVLASNWRTHLRGLSVAQLKRVGQCRERLRAYKVPMVCVASESLEEARELFVRINSLGTPLGAADRAFARASRFDLRELAEDTWQHLPRSFQGVRYEILLQTRALLDGIGDVGERAFEEVAKLWDGRAEKDADAVAQFTKVWDRQRRAICLAIDYLRERFSVLDDGLLPSEYMLATSSVFFYHRGGQPSARQAAELRKWFWATAVGKRYSGRGFRANILKDAEFFRRLATKDTARFKFEDLVDTDDLIQTIYGQRASTADALYCLLISQRPSYLTNGHEMPTQEYASPANRKDKHHIFPKALLSRHGVSPKRANSIVNLCFLSAEENNYVGARRPSVYLDEFRQMRHFGRVMRSHLIPYDQHSGLWNEDVADGYKTFLRVRARELCKAFEMEARVKLFRL